MFQWGFAQQNISGTVSDSAGVPIPGATVLVLDTNNGVTTDFDGNFSIMASAGDVLSVSYVGYTAQNITVGSSTTINVVLSTDNTLEEVVVTALGITREQLCGGSLCVQHLIASECIAGDHLSLQEEVSMSSSSARIKNRCRDALWQQEW
jgi:hypothetical protein